MIRNTAELYERLSRPAQSTITSISRLDGDLIVLGAGGKMGPSMAKMARRAIDAAGKANRVIAASRFSDRVVQQDLTDSGIESIQCDLLDQSAVSGLPDCPNVLFLAGHKFGTTMNPEQTWAINTIAPANVAQRYKHAKIVAFSTGCVYPIVSVSNGGSKEEDPLEPHGEYSNSCVGRERVFQHFAKEFRTPLALLRLNYAIDLRYGVLTDIALRVWRGEAIDLSTGYVNVIWEGDACGIAIQCLDKASNPPFIVNVTGPGTVSVRKAAEQLGRLLNKKPNFDGSEGDAALLSNASRMVDVFGPPEVSLEQMVEWTAGWIQNGGPLFDKPTHYDVRDGRF